MVRSTSSSAQITTKNHNTHTKNKSVLTPKKQTRLHNLIKNETTHMLIFDGKSQPIILDSIHGPTVTEHMWVLDLIMRDFTIAPLLMLEEVVCPSIRIMVRGFEFTLPANWVVLVYDRETAQLDVVELAETAGREFTAMTYGPHKSAVSPAIITVTDYYLEHKNVGPSLNKHQMLCHPIGPDEWISVSPSDAYNKYLKDIIVGDLVG